MTLDIQTVFILCLYKWCCAVFSLRSPPRPSPGSLHYSDEDVSTKYNDLIPAESSSLTEKPSEISDSQVTNVLSRDIVSLCVLLCVKGQFTQ